MIKQADSARYGFIDCIRGIAAVLVMLQHALYSSGLLGNWPHAQLTGFIPNFFELGETGVVAFFLVSGFVIPFSLEKTNDFRLFWTHRIFRLYPLYLAVYFLTVIAYQGGGMHGIREYVVNFLSHLLMIREYVHQKNFVGGSWTLSLEMVWYLGLSALFLFSLNKKTGILVAIAVAVSLLSCLISACGLPLPMGRLSMLVCCVTGLVCYRYNRADISVKRFATYLAILAMTIALNLTVGFLWFPGNDEWFCGVEIFPMVRNSWILAAVIFLVPLFTCKSAIWQNSVLTFLGKISYSVYLVHALVLFALDKTSIKGVPHLLMTFALTLLFATLTYYFIEAPGIRFGKKFGPKKRQINEVATATN